MFFDTTPNFSEWVLWREEILLCILTMREGKELITLRQNEVTTVVTDGPCTVSAGTAPRPQNDKKCVFSKMTIIRFTVSSAVYSVFDSFSN